MSGNTVKAQHPQGRIIYGNITAENNPANGYTQTFPSPLAEWVVNHNLGRKVNATVYTLGGQELPFSTIIHTTNNTCVIQHDSPMAGSVRVL